MTFANKNRFDYAIAFLAGALCATLCHAESAQTIYKVTDENGHITYTDVAPGPGNHTVEEYRLETPNAAMPVLPTTATPPATGTAAAAKAEYITVIAQPPDGSTIPMGPGNFTVAAQTSPQLGASERLQLEVDGSAFGSPQRHTTWKLENIFRGAHTLRVIRLDDTGNAMDTSEISTVFVLRPSVVK